MPGTPLTVFTKPWTEPLPALADKLASLGLDGVELAVRPGYQVEPQDVGRGLPEAARILGERGLKIVSIAGETDERTIEACGEAGVRIIRICAPIDLSVGYLASVDAYRRKFDALLPALERCGVAIGVQNHYGVHVGSAVGLLHMIGKYDPGQVCAVLDMAHCAVDGEPVAMAVDIVKDRLNGLVNFKSAFHHRVNGPEDEAVYKVHWTTHQHAGYSWRELVAALKNISYAGAFCLPAEYSSPAGKGQRMGDDVLPYLRADIAFLRGLMQDSGF
ncbi:sugar phosphate isomerase/epimerase family protein [Geminicoccus roseus]|uniref:sugar phosphate isomerase/epimerase family protein n=1 Tax=Geminicoccus roseus TaxID=404900 RepID=UPI000405E085|nr:TIM barrel protein [Geminicoccus roseus]